MKILIVSDTHGRLNYLQKAINRTGKFDMLIHCGDVEGDEAQIRAMVDCPIQMVAGNNDFFSGLEREEIFSVGAYTVFLTHGHRYRVNSGTEQIKEAAWQRGADIVMFGHTHKPMLDLNDTVMAVNPGSISQPRQDGRKPTYVLMELDRQGLVHFTLNTV